MSSILNLLVKAFFCKRFFIFFLLLYLFYFSLRRKLFLSLYLDFVHVWSRVLQDFDFEWVKNFAKWLKKP